MAAFKYVEPRIGEGGLACLALCAWLMDGRTSLKTLRGKFVTPPGGIKPAELADIAKSLGIITKVSRLEGEIMNTMSTPAILQWKNGYAVFNGTYTNGDWRIFAPYKGWERVPLREVSAAITGVIMEVSYVPIKRGELENPKFDPFRLVHLNREMRATILQCFILTAFLQIYYIVNPLFLRVVLDDVVVSGDTYLLDSLAIGFIFLAIFNSAAGLLRNIAVQNISAMLNWDISSKIFHHLLRLPLPWYNKQKLSDVLGRLQGLDQVRAALSGMIGTVLDGLLSIVTLFILFVFSPFVGLLSTIGTLIYIFIRLISVRVARNLNRLATEAVVEEQGRRIELIRYIQTIKIMSMESKIESDWMSKFFSAISTTRNYFLSTSNFSNVQNLFSNIFTVASIFVCGKSILGGHMTIGVMTAALAYQSQFLQRFSSCFEQYVTWQLLEVQLDRLSHIVNEDEEDYSQIIKAAVASPITMEARSVSFRYNGDGPWIINDLSLHIEPGEHIAITGKSGCGKSTLLKLLCGLYAPETGAIGLWQEGVKIDTVASRQYIGAVLQDDNLLSGTLGENITHFDDDPDIDYAWECLTLADIDHTIRAMPQQLDTFVGDISDTLSGGQRQRIFLARALYRRPKVLILDEATSNLDIESEAKVVESIKSLNVTRVTVSHRPETINSAQKIYRFENGSLNLISGV